jgi:ureidoacrylate peracid hydrolase
VGIPTAIIMIDMQNMYLQPNDRDVIGWPQIWNFDGVVAECAALLAHARANGIPVIYTRTGARADGADAMPGMKKFMTVLESRGVEFTAEPGAWSSEILDAVAPQDGDIIVDKLRWDAFFGTPLEGILKNLKTERIIIAGLQTNVCVETTARTALMKNFDVAVPSDAVSTDGKQLHFNGLDSLRILYAEVAPWRELVEPDAPWETRFTTARYGRLDADYDTDVDAASAS